MRLGTYEILGELGRGGMGVVYRARRDDLDREVALKVLRLDGSRASLDLAHRFRREARSAAGLAAHPNVVGVHDAGSDGETLWLAMDLVPGGSLAARLAAEDAPPWRPDDAARLGVQIAQALTHAHAAGVLHRDIKPDNILMGTDDAALLTDFGLAGTRALDADATRLTRTGTVVGTPAYMPPEQALGLGADGRADVYALGATLYEVLTGRPPFVAGSTLELLTALLRDAPPPARALRPDVPVDLDAIVSTCLAKDPGDRYATADELRADLDRFLRGLPVAAHDAGGGARTWRAVRRHRAVIGMTAAAAALGGGAWWWAAATEAQRTGDRAEAERSARTVAVLDDAEAAAARWRRLLSDSGAAMRTLTRYAHHAPIPAAEIAAARAQVERAAEAVRPAAPALADGWSALAAFCAGAPDTAYPRLVAAAEAAGDDPFPHVLHALALLTGYTEDHRTPAMRFETTGATMTPPAPTAQERVVLERIETIMARAAASPWWGRLPDGDAIRDFAAGLLALAAARPGEAAERLAAAADHPLVGDEAAFLLGESLVREGRYAAAMQAYGRAHAWGWLRADQAAAGAGLALACDEFAAGRPAAPHVAQAARFAASAIAASPDAPGAHFLRAQCRMLEAGLLTAQRERVNAELVRLALTGFDDALARGYSPGVARVNRGTCHLTLAELDVAAQRDPRPRLEQAITEFTAATSGESGTVALGNRAKTHLVWAQWLLDTGGDPSERLPLALADVDEALRRDPRRLDLHVHAGDALRLWGDLQARRSESPLKRFAEAAQRYDLALQSNAAAPETLNHRGLLRAAIARWHLASGTDGARSELEAAITEYDAALRRRPGFIPAIVNRAAARHGLARDVSRTGGDPVPVLQAVVQDYSDALRLAPEQVEIHNNRGTARMQIGAILRRRGESPDEWFAAAREDLDTMIARRPDLASAWFNRGLLFNELGDAARQASQPFAAHWQNALRDFAEAIRCNAAHWNAWKHVAQIHYLAGRTDRALAAAEEALRIRPNDGHLQRMVAVLRSR